MRLAFPGFQAARLGFMRGIVVNPTQAETTALLAAMAVQPAQDRANLINNTIFSLKGAGVWAKLDWLHVFAAHDAQAGRVNWKNPAQVATVVSTPTFTVDRGYQGNGTSAAIDTSQVINALTNYKQDDAHAGLWVGNDATDVAPSLGLVAANYMSIVHRNAGFVATRMNNSTQTSTALPAPTSVSRGHTVTTRSVAASYDVYKNAALLANVVQTSGALAANAVTYLRTNVSFNSANIVAAGHGGSSLTAAEISSLYAALAGYMAAVGV